MANQISLNFPDETYSSSNKPNSDVVKADFTEIETNHNALDTAALYVDGTKKMIGDLDMDSNTIENLKAPSNDNDAARKIDGNPVGTVLEFAGSSLPSGYLWCRGAEVSRSTYSALFTVIGTTYGTGDGSTTFNLPDKRNRSGVGSGSDYTLGNNVGSKTHALSGGELPGHNHSITHNHTYSGTTSDLNTTPRKEGTGNTLCATNHSHTYSGTTSTKSGYSGTTHGVGTGTSFDITDRKLALNYIIKY